MGIPFWPIIIRIMGMPPSASGIMQPGIAAEAIGCNGSASVSAASAEEAARAMITASELQVSRLNMGHPLS
jgi:hypothetical protein